MGVVYEVEERSLRRRMALKAVPGAMACRRPLTTASIFYAKPGWRPESITRTSFRCMSRRLGGRGLHHEAHRRHEPVRDIAADPFNVWETAAVLGADLPSGGDKAQSGGIVHRDLKPSNSLLDLQARPWLTDFGLAVCGDDRRPSSLSERSAGTPRYLGHRSRRPTCQAPLSRRATCMPWGRFYIMPCAGCRRLTPLLPRRESLRQTLTTEPTLPSELAPDVDPHLERVAMTCLQKAPGRRYAAADEVAEELEERLRRDAGFEVNVAHGPGAMST